MTAPCTICQSQAHFSNRVTDLVVYQLSLCLQTTTTLWPREQPLNPDRQKAPFCCKQTCESGITHNIQVSHTHTNMFNRKWCRQRDVTELSAPLITARAVAGVVLLQSRPVLTEVCMYDGTWLRWRDDVRKKVEEVSEDRKACQK